MTGNNFIEQQQSMARELHGRELTADEIAVEFAKGDVYTRSQQLSQIKSELPDDMSPQEAARKTFTVRALDQMHQRLRSVDR